MGRRTPDGEGAIAASAVRRSLGFFLWKTTRFGLLRPKSGRVSFLSSETAHCLSELRHTSKESNAVTHEQSELASVAQSLVQSRVSADAPRAMLIRTIIRACDDARALLRSRRTDALVAELELLRRYSAS